VRRVGIAAHLSIFAKRASWQGVTLKVTDAARYGQLWHGGPRGGLIARQAKRAPAVTLWGMHALCLL